MCLTPIVASLPPDGGRPEINPEGELKLPCGKCHVCISKRSLEWATRARHEISEHEENCFLTLTYSDEHLCSQFTVKEHFQKFMKRLRKKIKGKKIKYMVTYEYGTKTFRPHMHALIFGYTPPNQELERITAKGSKLYTSPEIEKLWDKGFHSIGEANEKTAYYIASYALKGKERDIIHPHTGEELTIKDEMNVSKRPAIGLDFLSRNSQQIVQSGNIVPRYYVKQLEKVADLSEKNPSLYTNAEKKFMSLMKNVSPHLIDEHQQKIYSNLIDKGDIETYAKFVIESAEMEMNSNELREEISQNEKRRREYLQNHLKQKRDNYVTYIKEK